MAISPDQARRNWWLHVLEGTALIGSAAAINANTVGSALVERLGGSVSMVAFMPMAVTLGFAFGPILTAHWLDRRSAFVPVLRKALPPSRLPLLFTALTLWIVGESRWTLWTVVGGSVAYGVIGGLSIGAWQQLVARTTAPAERPALFAQRYLFSNLLGWGMGWVVTVVLSRWPGTSGYALLYLVAFIGAGTSYRLITKVSEPETARSPFSGVQHSFFHNLRELPPLFRGDRRLWLYLLTAILVNAQYVYIGFLGGHARRVLGAGEGYLGQLTSSQMAGAVLGTFVVSRVGNRLGARQLLLISRVLFIAVALGALVAEHDYAFRILFALYGMAYFVNLVGHNTITLALMPPGRSSTVLAVFSLAQVPSMLLFGQLGAWLWRAGQGMPYVAAAAASALFAAIATVWPIRPNAPADWPLPSAARAPAAPRERAAGM